MKIERNEWPLQAYCWNRAAKADECQQGHSYEVRAKGESWGCGRLRQAPQALTWGYVPKRVVHPEQRDSIIGHDRNG